MSGRVRHCDIVVQYVCVLWNTVYVWKGKALLQVELWTLTTEYST